MAEYEHSQNGPWRFLLYAITALELSLAWMLRNAPAISVIFLIVALLCFLLGQSIARLTVCDDGSTLRIRFGPIGLIGTRVLYEDMVSAAADQSSWLDGWGLHYRPGHGWIYNIWGFDCVRIELQDGRIVRVGTDDQANLLEFLQRRIERFKQS